MQTAVRFLDAWKDLVIGFFLGFPLPAALVVLLAIAAFWLLGKKKRWPGPVNFVVVFLAWAIVTPILDLVLTVVVKVWAVGSATANATGRGTMLLYAIYTRHPILALAATFVAVAGYFLWKKAWPKVLPLAVARVAALAIGWFVFLTLAAALLDRFSPERTTGSPPIAAPPASDVIPPPRHILLPDSTRR